MTLKARSSVYFTCTMTIASCLETNNNFNNDLNDLDFFFIKCNFIPVVHQTIQRQRKKNLKLFIESYILIVFSEFH